MEEEWDSEAIKQLLNRSLAQLDQRTLARLRSARLQAVTAMKLVAQPCRYSHGLVSILSCMRRHSTTGFTIGLASYCLQPASSVASLIGGMRWRTIPVKRILQF